MGSGMWQIGDKHGQLLTAPKQLLGQIAPGVSVVGSTQEGATASLSNPELARWLRDADMDPLYARNRIQ
jgi:hypothetical protein